MLLISLTHINVLVVHSTYNTQAGIINYQSVILCIVEYTVAVYGISSMSKMTVSLEMMCLYKLHT